DRLSTARHFPVPPVMGKPHSQAACPGPRRPSPVPRTTLRPFHPPYAGRFSNARSRLPNAFHGLRPTETGSAPPRPPSGGIKQRRRRLRLMPPTGRSHAPEGRLSLHFDAALSNDAGSEPPGTPASPRTGLAPAGCPELDARLHPANLLDLYERPSRWTHLCYAITERHRRRPAPARRLGGQHPAKRAYRQRRMLVVTDPGIAQQSRGWAQREVTGGRTMPERVRRGGCDGAGATGPSGAKAR